MSLPAPATVNVPGGYTLGPALDPRESGVLYISSKRDETHAGSMDIFRVRYRYTP